MYVPFGSQIFTLPVTDVVWSDEGFRFKITLSFGNQGGVFLADGNVDAQGAIKGDIEPESGSGSGALSFLDLQGFEGRRAG